jgi:hypothetical protein
MLHLRGGLISGRPEKGKVTYRFARNEESFQQNEVFPIPRRNFVADGEKPLIIVRRIWFIAAGAFLSKEFVRAVAPATTTEQSRE